MNNSAAVAEDDLDWTIRSNMWLDRSGEPARQAKRSPRKALVLVGHGISLRVEGGALKIQNGFTHYPQKRETLRYFRGDLDMPSRIILLDGDGSISFDVLSWLSEQQVPLVRIDWKGSVVVVSSGYGFAANQQRVKWQLDSLSDNQRRMDFCIKLISKKIEGCVLTLEKAIRRSDLWERAMERSYADLSKLELDPPHDIAKLRSLEANSAAAYFRAWKHIPLKWHDSSRRPIPDEWRTVAARTSAFHQTGNRNASHPVNAILNYAYAVLQSQLQIQTIAQGYDPTIGLMHHRGGGSSAFIFDLMEPERPKVDRRIIEFLKSEELHPVDFTIRGDGVVRLNPQLAAHVARIVAATAHLRVER